MEGTTTFAYVEEGMRDEEYYQASMSSTGIELGEVTHVDETILPAQASNSGRASQAASISVNLDPASKRMVDDLVDSITTDDGEDADSLDQSPNGIPHGFADPEHGPSPAINGGDETSYGLIGSSTARQHFGDLQSPVPNSPRPLLPSITNSPFALQPGEVTPGTKRKTPSHSLQSSQTRFPLQRQPIASSADSDSSKPSTMPDPTAPNLRADGFNHNQPLVKNVFPSFQIYARGRGPFTTFGNEPLHAEEPNFLSLEVFGGSTWGGGSDQSGRKEANVMTPPNGQGAG